MVLALNSLFIYLEIVSALVATPRKYRITIFTLRAMRAGRNVKRVLDVVDYW